MREGPTGCLHGVMPWTSAARQRRTLTMRYKSGPEWRSHRDHPDHAQRPTRIDPRLRRHLGLPNPAALQPATVALVSGDRLALTAFAESALASWKQPPMPGIPTTRAPLWRAGRNLSCEAPPPAGCVTPEMRFLMDACGFVHLRAVLSPTEVAAARQDYAEAVEQGGIVGRPALERLITHPRLLPIYQEFAGECAPPVLPGLLHCRFFSPTRATDSSGGRQAAMPCTAFLLGCCTTHHRRQAQSSGPAASTASESTTDTMCSSRRAQVAPSARRGASS